MHFRRVVPIALVVGLLLLPGTADAQFDKVWQEWFGHIAAGYSAPQGDTGNLLSGGWNISGGATYKPNDWPIGIVMDLGYNDFGLTRDAVDFLDSTGGNASIWSLTAGGIWSLKTGGLIGFNLQAGAGGYYSQGHLSDSGTVVDDSVSSFDFGFNFGAAITFRLPSDSVIYLEAKYHWVDTQATSKFIPVVVGFRW